MLKAKVPIIFFGTAGFSPRRDGRYTKEILGSGDQVIKQIIIIF